jgi:maltose alpha-D-glucosyltransferase/alpha-amylase
MAGKKHSLWYKDAIIYELHVKAFYDSNGDGVGDFRGLIEKLDYLQDLGITAIWLLPFYPSPFKDDGYDISDYRGIHSAYGTLRDFRTFIREAHRRNLKVITELVVNHTSDQHLWFQTARWAKQGSARRNFYVWSDTDTRFPETRIIFTDTETSNWAWDPVAGAYYWHRFFSHQPDLNHNNPRVVQAVSRVLRFWLKMGVNGLRLDAIPYLCVREGTNNENLPETHAVIKELRRQVDLAFQDRMLLAEANQWPEDVVAYFGEEDECHMAFHFPLMPRMFMALRQEDRYPITEILKRTPKIPETCQWGLFLRNHDELTLEMVTDEERDYMYREYANDPRMRCNIGIRRRLAPLLNNSLRRMELLYSLLFSLPGTPILYYGDEIAMGDNIYLGDRDGVRTPMQWSADRNAGFSRADPARLYLPVIMDTVYGYQAVNVEAQERNPSSFLHFMKRMISLRRQHKAFGRGSLEILYPDNRKILAYFRKYKGEVILAVANLSRFVQPAQFDLSEFHGWTPVEMIGRTEFPTIGELPYFLTLGPHAFYWFRLEPQPEPIRLSVPKGKAQPSLPRLVLEDGWEGLLLTQYHYTLEQDILHPFIRKQRWFRGKAREVGTVLVNDWSKLGGELYVLFVKIRYIDEGDESYVIPLKMAFGSTAKRVAADVSESIVAWVKTSKGEGVLYDALVDRTVCCTLFSAIADGRRYPTHRESTLAAFPTAVIEEEKGTEVECLSVRGLSAEQSNTSVILDDAYMLKIFRRIEEGVNPDMEIGLYLTERTDFRNIAPVAGGISLKKTGCPDTSIALLQAYVPNEGDGWNQALRELQGFCNRVREKGKGPAAEWFRDQERFPGAQLPDERITLLGAYVEAVEKLGRRTAEFHRALCPKKGERAFAPEPMRSEDIEALAEDFARKAQRSLELLSFRIRELSGDSLRLADAVLTAGPLLVNRFQDLGQLRSLPVRIRCHGDYHLGQVLWTGDDFVLLDFEGEPLKTLDERRQKHPAFKDVAGMLRSFSYAVQTKRAESAVQVGEDREVFDQWLSLWERWVTSTFVESYLAEARGEPFVPKDPEDTRLLLQAFVLDKAFYELTYELNSRPNWVHIPLEGIVHLIENM